MLITDTPNFLCVVFIEFHVCAWLMNTRVITIFFDQNVIYGISVDELIIQWLWIMVESIEELFILFLLETSCSNSISIWNEGWLMYPCKIIFSRSSSIPSLIHTFMCERNYFVELKKSEWKNIWHLWDHCLIELSWYVVSCSLLRTIWHLRQIISSIKVQQKWNKSNKFKFFKHNNQIILYLSLFLTFARMLF